MLSNLYRIILHFMQRRPLGIVVDGNIYTLHRKTYTIRNYVSPMHQRNLNYFN